MKEHALSSLQMHFLFSLCSSNWTPSFISPKDYDYSPVSESCQTSPGRFFFHVILQAETKRSTVPRKHLQKTCRLCGSLLPSQEHFSLFSLWVLSPNNNKKEMWCSSKRWGPVNFLYLQQNQRRSLFVSHLGIQFTEHSICLYSPALNKYEQIEGLTKGSFKGFLSYEMPNNANYFCFTFLFF